MQLGFNLYIAAAVSNGRTVCPKMVITCTKSVAKIVANLVENLDFVFRLHDRYVTHEPAPLLAQDFESTSRNALTQAWLSMSLGGYGVKIPTRRIRSG